MTNTIIEVKNLVKTFNDNHIVLDNINFKVYEGDFVSILGASGSGKSTLLCIMGGMDTQTSGEMLFENIELSSLKEKELAKLRRTKMGFVFQFFNLAPYLTVKENILLPVILDGKSPKQYAEKLEELLNYLKISNYLNQLPTKLSGGEQQRVAIARALLYSPKVIFLDEPTGNLDSKNSTEIMQLLKQINKERNTTIIQVTHSEKNSLYGNRIVRIEDGKIKDEEIISENDVYDAVSENDIEDGNNKDEEITEKTEINDDAEKITENGIEDKNTEDKERNIGGIE